MAYCSYMIEPKFGKISKLLGELEEFPFCKVSQSRSKSLVLLIINSPSLKLIKDIEKYLKLNKDVHTFYMVGHKKIKLSLWKQENSIVG